jgi:hypothetical protein
VPGFAKVLNVNMLHQQQQQQQQQQQLFWQSGG